MTRNIYQVDVLSANKISKKTSLLKHAAFGTWAGSFLPEIGCDSKEFHHRSSWFPPNCSPELLNGGLHLDVEVLQCSKFGVHKMRRKSKP